MRYTACAFQQEAQEDTYHQQGMLVYRYIRSNISGCYKSTRRKTMAGTKINGLNELGQSVWLDFIQRSLIQSGDLLDYVEKGLSGVTSNPAIFEKAISSGSEYDSQMEQLAHEGKSPQEIYEALTVEDARQAAGVLLPLFEKTSGQDGFFSLEV